MEGIGRHEFVTFFKVPQNYFCGVMIIMNDGCVMVVPTLGDDKPLAGGIFQCSLGWTLTLSPMEGHMAPLGGSCGCCLSVSVCLCLCVSESVAVCICEFL